MVLQHLAPDESGASPDSALRYLGLRDARVVQACVALYSRSAIFRSGLPGFGSGVRLYLSLLYLTVTDQGGIIHDALAEASDVLKRTIRLVRCVGSLCVVDMQSGFESMCAVVCERY